DVCSSDLEHWPRFVRNRIEQFEGRLSQVQIMESPSVLLAGMAGSRLPVVVSHGEGRAEFSSDATRRALLDSGLLAFRYVNGHGEVASSYPANPNGSPDALAAATSRDGRVRSEERRVGKECRPRWPAGPYAETG